MAYGDVGRANERVSGSVVLNLSFVSQASGLLLRILILEPTADILNPNLWVCICVQLISSPGDSNAQPRLRNTLRLMFQDPLSLHTGPPRELLIFLQSGNYVLKLLALNYAAPATIMIWKLPPPGSYHSKTHHTC